MKIGSGELEASVKNDNARSGTRSRSRAVPVAPRPLRSRRFEILGLLGRGGFGVVLEAFDRRRGHRVALKMLPTLDAAALSAIKREFRALCDVSHSNLVHLHELVSEDDECFFTMERVEGVDFVTWVRGTASAFAPTIQLDDAGAPVSVAPASRARAQRALSFSRARAALRQLTAAVSALHAAGKVHRDLKPSNVLVTAEGQVKVLDFGLTADLRARDGGDPREPAAGTPAYMAPEQIFPGPLEESADWYAVGVMLFEALTGDLPFQGTPMQMLAQKVRGDAPRLRERLPGVPDDLDELCAALLRRAPRDRPAGRAVAALLGDADLSGHHGAPSIPFVGREAELIALHDAFARAAEGRPVTVCVEGTSGMGKSALCRRFLDELADQGAALILAGRCYERESVPYKALDAVIDALTRHLCRLPRAEAEPLIPADAPLLARIFPVLREAPAIAEAPAPSAPIDPQRLRARAFAALRDLFERLAARRRVVVFIDDAQWGDTDSAALLHDLTAGEGAPPILLVLAYRSEDAAVSPSLRALLGDAGPGLLPGDRRTIAVGALPRSEAAELALSVAGDGVDPSLLAAVAEEAAGSPFFVGELCRYLRAGGDRLAAPGSRLAAALRHRVSDLSPESLSLLRLVSIAGRPLAAEVILDAAGLPLDAAGRALDALRVGHLARSSGAGGSVVEPYHDRIREAVAASLEPEPLRAIHRRLLAALDRAGEADPELLLLHARAAGLHARAAALAEQAAERAAAALAFERAAALYREACEAEGADTARLSRRLADALVNAGRGPEAAAAYRRAIVGAGPAEARELSACAASALLRAGHHDEGVAVLGRVLREVGHDLPGGPIRALVALAAVRARLAIRGLAGVERDASIIPAAELARLDLCWTAAAGFAGDAILSALFQSRHLLLALQVGEPYRLARALAMEILMHASRGAPPRRLAALVARASSLAARSESPHAIGLVKGMTGLAHYLAGRWKLGLACLAEGERLLADRCVGVAWELDMMRVFSLECMAYSGETAALCRRVPALVEEADRRGDRFAASMLRTGVQNLVWLCRDEPERGRREVETAEARWSRSGFHVQHFLHLFAHVQIDLYTGDGRAALARLGAAWPAMARSLVLRLPFIRICALHLRGRAALSALGAGGVSPRERRRLLGLVEGQARALDRQRAPWASAYALSLRAGAAAWAGDSQAAARLDDAAAAFDALDMALHAAITRRHRGLLAGGAAGAALGGVADAFLRAEAVKSPERMAAMWLPMPRSISGNRISGAA